MLIERAVRAKLYPFDRTDFERRREAGRAAHERGESFPSLHTAVGRITVHPLLMHGVRRALQDRPRIKIYEDYEHPENNNSFVLLSDQEPGAHEIEGKNRRLLRAFFLVTSARFLEVVNGVQPLYSSHSGLSASYTAGAYEYDLGDAWHTDTFFRPDVTYTMSLQGPLTEHATGSFRRETDFQEDETMLRVLPQDWTTYDHGEIVLHDALTGVHQAPPPEFAGQDRIFFRASGD